VGQQQGQQGERQWESHLIIGVVVTGADVTVTVQDDPTGDFRRRERVWGRVIARPEGKTLPDCVRAALRALEAGSGGWVDLLGGDDGVLPMDW
jgi:hypothetical protein